MLCLYDDIFSRVFFSKDLQILTTSRHLVHLNLQIALGLTQIVFLAGGKATHNEVGNIKHLVKNSKRQRLQTWLQEKPPHFIVYIQIT